MRVESERGTPLGAGVLLADRLVVTCAHVLGPAGAASGGEAATVRISSAFCHPEWSRSARVVQGSWVYRGTRRADVALLELDEPTPCASAATLWRAPLSSGQVRVYGFPRADRFGVGVKAELAGVGGREGEWATLHPVQMGAPWIEEGFSGAGVVADGGEFDKHVIGIVVRDFVNGEARAAWMLPTETMLAHIRLLKPYVAGEPTTILSAPANGLPGAGVGMPSDPGTLAMAHELAELLRSGWAGTVLLVGGSATGTSWLTDLLLTADPAARVTTQEAPAARQGATLGFASVDAAFDAAGRRSADVRTYLTERFGFRADGSGDLVSRLLHRRPPFCLAITSVDRCLDPDELISSLIEPLARGARWRGIRLVLGFDSTPPRGLSYEVALRPETSGVQPGARASRAEAEGAIAELRAAENDAGTRYSEWELRFFAAPRLPQRVAPQLAIRCAIADETVSEWDREFEYAVIRDSAVAGLDDVKRFHDAMEGLIERWRELSRSLELYRERAQRALAAEDPQLTRLYSKALRSLRKVPIDLRLARKEVARYVETVNRRVEGEPGGDEGNGRDEM